jgi:hypothetical protein
VMASKGLIAAILKADAGARKVAWSTSCGEKVCASSYADQERRLEGVR